MKKKEDIKGIDYIKAFAILSVLVLHLWLPEEIYRKYFLYLYTLVGVPIFMILTGHNYALSFEFNNKVWFSRNSLYKKLRRIILPYIFILLLELILIFKLEKFEEYRSKKALIKIFLINGSSGPGGYYSPTIIQIILIYFPLLLILNTYLNKMIKKYKAFISLVIVIIIEAIYEICINYLGKEYDETLIQQIYRIVALRHITFLQLGIILYYNKEKILEKLNYIFPLSIGGGIYIYLTYYKDYVFFPYNYWKVVSTPMMFYALFFIIIILKYSNTTKKFFLEKVVVIIGKASYHIFLVQLIYYGMLKVVIFNNWLDYIAHIFICLIIGIFFYYLESKIVDNLLSLKKL